LSKGVAILSLRLFPALLTIILSAVATGCGLLPWESAAARALAGTYVLESVDGVPAVGPPGPLDECPQPASLGELQLSGPSSGPTLVYYSLDVGAALTAHDAGSWSVTGDRVRFRS